MQKFLTCTKNTGNNKKQKLHWIQGQHSKSIVDLYTRRKQIEKQILSELYLQKKSYKNLKNFPYKIVKLD